MMITETFHLLKTKYGLNSDELYLSEIIIGSFLTAVRLSNNNFGMASTYLNPYLRRAGKRNPNAPFGPGKMNNTPIADLFDQPDDTPFIQSIQVAVLNALSTPFLNENLFTILLDTDPVNVPEIPPHTKVTIVGAFKSYIRMFKDTNCYLRVLERNPDILKEDEFPFFRSAEASAEVLSDSDFIIITGSTMVNGSLETLLEQCPEKATVIVTGPSGSFIPDVLFNKGVNFIGATKIHSPTRMMEVAGQGGSGYHLFRNGGQKITISPKMQ